MSGTPTDQQIRWGDDGLVPVVAVDAASGDVLMVASMNAEALAATRETGVVHYWSRSRNELWRKGATSGHTQRMTEIRINCNRDSLLLLVEQQGAVCHDGYPTCYYRRLESDGRLAGIRNRVFDPHDVYGSPPADGQPADDSPEATSAHRVIDRWLGAYRALRDTDFSDVSNTSRLLRASDDRVSPRIADELEEFAGVLAGTHRHGAFADDVALEAAQCFYWCALASIRESADDVAVWRLLLGAFIEDMSQDRAAMELRSVARLWRQPVARAASLLAETISLVGNVTRQAGIDPIDLVARDLDNLATRPYLAAYFAQTAT